MMKMILVRHGEPNYQVCLDKGMVGFNKNLAPLSKLGESQAEELAGNPIMEGAELIVASPYTRSMQTAAILARRLKILIDVNINIHEWLEDRAFTYIPPELAEQYHQEFLENKGKHPKGQVRAWETIDEMGNRIVNALKQYVDYKKIIVVSHGGVMKRLVDQAKIPFCGYVEIDFDENFQYKMWAE